MHIILEIACINVIPDMMLFSTFIDRDVVYYIIMKSYLYLQNILDIKEVHYYVPATYMICIPVKYSLKYIFLSSINIHIILIIFI